MPRVRRCTPVDRPIVEASSLSAACDGQRGRLEVIWKTFKRTRDENLRNTLIEHHMPLVRSIAERVLQTLPKSIDARRPELGRHLRPDGRDQRLRPDRGIKFKTYCTTRIRGSILDELRSQDWVPRLVRLKAHRLDRAIRSSKANSAARRTSRDRAGARHGPRGAAGARSRGQRQDDLLAVGEVGRRRRGEGDGEDRDPRRPQGLRPGRRPSSRATRSR
jgi:hypothetical protein